MNWRYRQVEVPDLAPTGEHDEVGEVLDDKNCLVVNVWNPKERDTRNLMLIAMLPKLLNQLNEFMLLNAQGEYEFESNEKRWYSQTHKILCEANALTEKP